MENHTHFLKLLDFTPAEIQQFLDTAADLKAKKKAGIPHKYLEGKNVALIFEKTSTRTRCAFEVAAQDLGMGSTYLGPTGSQIGVKESIADTARVLGRMYDGIEYRGFGQELVEELAKYAGVPVFNGLTNEFHPTQILADFLTVQEHFGQLKGLKFVYLGDARYNIVLYSAYMETTQSQTEWKLVEIPFTFYGSDPNQVPTHLILTFTCSGYGDFFDGSTDSWMYIDDIELVY